MGNGLEVEIKEQPANSGNYIGFVKDGANVETNVSSTDQLQPPI
ncbi:hypothetical protein OK016_01185 [Vibrio chagasii]|nr:hypothetical protein [Vibrio chagasii]